jgi:hypothetical protein
MSSSTDATSTEAGKTAAPFESILSRRLESLERDNRRLRRQGLFMLVAVALLLGLAVSIVVVAARHGMPGFVPEITEAKKFLVRDSEGRVRGAWGTNEDGSVQLVLQDTEGRPRMRLSVLADGSPGLAFVDTANHSRLVMALLPDETSTLVLGDRGGKTRTVLGLAADGASTLVFADGGGTTRAGIGVDARGIGTFTLLDRSGRDLSGAPSADESVEQQPDTSAPAPAAPPRQR